jgi:hypothetical protein
METNLRHPSLNTHKYKSFRDPNGEEIFESYVQQKTSNAYRIFWLYGPEKIGFLYLLFFCTLNN